MKNSTTTHSATRKAVLRSATGKCFLFLLIILSLSAPVKSQALATWNFNGNNHGIAGLFTALLPADFSSAIPTHAYNSDVYYGEGGWPTGAVDPNAYFEFGVAPLLGNSLNIANMAITLRRSSTGSSGGGPTRFVIRSSMDGYTSDLTGGTLSVNAATANLSPGASFLSMVLGVRFRIYGYQSTLSSGALSRLVMENIQVNGIGTILPAHIAGFGAQLNNGLGQVSYAITNNDELTTYEIQRSTDGRNFSTVHTINGSTKGTDFQYQYSDNIQSMRSDVFYYRLRINLSSGSTIYSDVSMINLTGKPVSPMILVQQSNGVLVKSSLSGARSVMLFTSNGQLLKSLAMAGNVLTTTIELPQHQPGIYYIQVSNGAAKENGSVFLK